MNYSILNDGEFLMVVNQAQHRLHNSGTFFTKSRKKTAKVTPLYTRR